MNWWLMLDGWAGRARYAALSAAVFFSQHLFVWLAFVSAHQPMPIPWWFWFSPFRVILFNQLAVPLWAPPMALVVSLAVYGLLTFLAFRRARHVKGNPAFAALTIVPGLQIAIFLWLSLAAEAETTVRADLADLPTEPAEAPTAQTVVEGLFAAMALSVGAVAFSTLVLGVYGYALFLISPFLIGLAIGFIANRKVDIGMGRTFALVFFGLVLAGMALIGLALEGLICLLLASPLIGGMAAVGAAVGYMFARASQPQRGQPLMSVALLPLLLLGEAALPPHAGFESVESTEVAAAPSAVWAAVVHMGPIPDAPAAPFRWGLAYPMRGEIMGRGVGAVRRGVFSTGVAYERVTEWEPGRKLSFIVLSDPPTMRELSPYEHVNAPHVRGYFRTLDARFTITPLANGRTRLTLATRHELDLEPALYWIPVAQWATHANKVRVLAHFREQAEASVVKP